MMLVAVFLVTWNAVLGWEHSATLDKEGHYQLSWTVHPYQDITFEAVVKTKGYVGLGLSPRGKMEGSDLAIGWVKNGEAFLHDYHVTKDRTPKLDLIQDWLLVTGQENATHTTIQVRRRLRTCDSQDFAITNDTMRIIWSYHHQDPSSPKSLSYHGVDHRGYTSLLLLQPPFKSRLPTHGLKVWDVYAPNITIRHDVDRSFACSAIDALYLGRTHHAIRVEPLIQPGNEQYIRQITLYQCLGVGAKDMEGVPNGKSYHCHEPSSPKVFSRCEDVFAIWVQGGEGVQIPDHVGIPMGEHEARYFLIEIRYDNPNRHKGVMDMSGLKLFYTSKLRKHVGATMLVGSVSEACMMIPPGQEAYTVSGHLDPQCVISVMPSDGIKVFGALMHGNSLAREIVVRHFRKDAEIHPLVEDHNYDPKLQQYRLMVQEKKILASDHLVVECTYDTRARVKTTFGGYSSKDEACLVYLFYYPRIARSQVLSCPADNLLVSLAGIHQIKELGDINPSLLRTLNLSASSESDLIERPSQLRGRPWKEYLHTYQWTSSFLPTVQKVTMFSPHRSLCNLGDGGRFEMPLGVSYPEITEPLLKVNECPEPTTALPFFTGTFTQDDKAEMEEQDPYLARIKVREEVNSLAGKRSISAILLLCCLLVIH